MINRLVLRKQGLDNRLAMEVTNQLLHLISKSVASNCQLLIHGSLSALNAFLKHSISGLNVVVNDISCEAIAFISPHVDVSDGQPFLNPLTRVSGSDVQSNITDGGQLMLA